MNDVVLPGVYIGSLNEYNAGDGVYLRNTDIISNACGTIEILNAGNMKPTIQIKSISVSKEKTLHSGNVRQYRHLQIGDEVLCQITKIMMNQVNADIIFVGSNKLPKPTRGVIRREDVRLNEIDKVVMHECFRASDFVKAVVISLGDSKQYFLSTAKVELGVFIARHEGSGRFLVPISWKVCSYYNFYPSFF